MPDVKILRAKEWMYGNGMIPSRVVLLKWNDEDKFSTHVEVRTNINNEKGAFAHGHYFHPHHATEDKTHLQLAEEDFEQRTISGLDEEQLKQYIFSRIYSLCMALETTGIPEYWEQFKDHAQTLLELTETIP